MTRAVEAPREVSRNHSTLDFCINLDASNIHPQRSPPPPTPLAEGTHTEGHCPGNLHINPQGPQGQCRHTHSTGRVSRSPPALSAVDPAQQTCVPLMACPHSAGLLHACCLPSRHTGERVMLMVLVGELGREGRQEGNHEYGR